jgi:hypothetical protein
MSIHRDRVVAGLSNENDTLLVDWQSVSTLAICCDYVEAIAYANASYAELGGI